MGKYLDFTGLTYLVNKIKTLINNKADKTHTHNYAGSSTPGGAATTALKCTGDSDTLDGYHGDSYVLGYSGYGANYFNSTDLNNWTRSGNYATQSGCTNIPSGVDGWGTIFIIKGMDGRISQYASFWNETGNPLWYRTLNSTTWSAWSKVRDGGNADMVDGCHAWQMQTLDAAGKPHGNAWLMQAHHNRDNDGYFKLYCGDGSVGTKVDKSNLCDNATNATRSNAISSTGFGDTNFTYCQTDKEFYGRSGFCHYLIANHGAGESYYNYVIGLPFWDAPIYQRQTGNTTAKSGWHKFYTTENITYGTAALTPGTSSLATGSIYLQYE